MYHSSSTGGHSGVQATAKRIASLLYWKGMWKQIRQLVRECQVCQQNKAEHLAYPGLLQPLPMPKSIFTDISMDFIEGLPRSLGKEVIFVVVDRCTKYAHFMSLTHPYSATTVAQTFMDNVFKLHGMPESIVSDRDPIFLSNFWQDLFKLQGVALLASSAYHPQTDGQTEIVNKCLETYLRCMTGDRPASWAKWLPMAEWWYNTTYHSSTGMTPFEGLYGFQPPIHMPYFPNDSAVAAVDIYMRDREGMIQTLKHHLQRAQSRMKLQADKKRTYREFSIGDMVFLKLQPYKQGSVTARNSEKLSPKYYGPYQIMDRIGKVAYKLKLPSSAQVHPVFHVSQLKRAIGTASCSSELPISKGSLEGGTLQPLAILDRRMVKRRNRAAAQLLVHWTNTSPADATWEYADELRLRFPLFNLGDKGLEGKGNVMV
ncbi:hypothetical protein CDL15_Pgr014233 [Punica granatum]|uniref:Integrase catalytic domain-containing protein n=1 Tax=Punica granatum TaxID=22663 RepID=A0A218WE09_PUNGR|nr:hypothetical protein CDL15_Pgr014233 [Punica granatum]